MFRCAAGGDVGEGNGHDALLVPDTMLDFHRKY
jgi:hypothetical protein